MFSLRSKPMVFLFPKHGYQSHLVLMNLKTSLSIKEYTYVGLLLLKESCFSDFYPKHKTKMILSLQDYADSKVFEEIKGSFRKGVG